MTNFMLFPYSVVQKLSGAGFALSLSLQSSPWYFHIETMLHPFSSLMGSRNFFGFQVQTEPNLDYCILPLTL